VIIPLWLLKSVTVNSSLTLGKDSLSHFDHQLSEILGYFDWKITRDLHGGKSKYSFQKSFDSDPDLADTIYKDSGVTFEKVHSHVVALEVGIETALQSMEGSRTEEKHMTNVSNGAGKKIEEIEGALRQDEQFWLVRTFVKEIEANCYVPADKHVYVKNHISEIFHPPIECSVVSREVFNGDGCVLSLQCYFPYSYDYRVLSKFDPRKATTSLERVAAAHSLPENDSELASSVCLIYEGRYAEARNILTEAWARRRGLEGQERIIGDLLWKLAQLERIQADESSHDYGSLTREEKETFLRTLNDERSRLGFARKAKNLYQLDVDLSSAIAEL
jgi:hypothetical protein